jgi:hypothetical protein
MKNWSPILLHGRTDEVYQAFPSADLGVADRIPIMHYQNDVAGKIGRLYTWSVDDAKRRFAAWINAFRVGWVAVALLGRTMIDGSSRGTPSWPKVRRAGYASDQSNRQDRVAPKGRGIFGVTLVWVCIGLTSMCSVAGFILLAQVRALKSEMASSEREFAATKGRLVELDKIVKSYANKPSEMASNRSELKTQPTQFPIALNDSDMQFIHQFIKVAPPLPGAQPRLKVGDELPQSASLPIPDAVAERLPKLQDARFAIDQNGAIVISVAGNSRIDVVIAQTPTSTAK